MLVYLLEDDDAEAGVVAAVLEGAGHVVRRFAGGADFLAAVGEARPDVAVVDLLLPDLRGDEVLRALGPGGPRTVITTGVEEFAGDVADFPRITCYLVKPLDLDRLLRCVEAGDPSAATPRLDREDLARILALPPPPGEA